MIDPNISHFSPKPIHQYSQDLSFGKTLGFYTKVRDLASQATVAGCYGKEEGRTALQIAISEKNWQACKALIDDNEPLTPADKENIHQYLQSHNVRRCFYHVFTTPCLKPDVPEVFFNGRFQELSSVRWSHEFVAMVSKASGVVLLNIAEENPTAARSCYGAVMQWLIDDEFEPVIPLAENHQCIVIRGRVDCLEGLPRLCKNVMEVFKSKLLLAWMFRCHNDGEGFPIGQNSVLRLENGRGIIEDIGKRVAQHGAMIFSSCESAPFAEGFSDSAPHCFMHGSPLFVTNEYYFVDRLSPRLNFPIIVPSFVKEDYRAKFHRILTYRNKKKIMEYSAKEYRYPPVVEIQDHIRQELQDFYKSTLPK